LRHGEPVITGRATHRIGGKIWFDLDDVVDFINGTKVDPAA
jgi:hypothetical protein